MRAAAAGLLTLLYMVAVGSWTPWDLALGAALSLLLLFLFRDFTLPDPGHELRRHPGAFIPGIARLALAAVWEFGIGSLRVLRAIRRGGDRAGIVEVPIEERSEAAVALSGFFASLAPDEFLVDVDWSRKVMVMHVIDASDPDEIRRRHDELYKRYVAPLFT